MIKKIAKTLIIIFFTLAMVSLIVLLMLKNDYLRVWVLEKSLPIISQKSGYEITVIKPESKDLENWRFAEIIVKKNNQQLLKIKNLAIEYNFKQLLYSKIVVNSLTAKQVVVNSTNFNNTGELSANTNIEHKKSNPIPFAIQFFQIDILQIQNSIFTNQQKYFLAGNIAFLTKQFPLVFNLTAKSLSGIPVVAKITSKSIDDDNLKISGILTHKNGTIKLDGVLQKEKLDVAVQINKLPIELIAGWFGYDIKGDISSNLKVYNNYLNPIIEGDFNLPIIYQKLPVEITGSGKYQDKNITVNLGSQINLKYINKLLRADEHKISGIIKAQINIAGAISQPQISGKVRIDNGYYKNWQTGFVINNLWSEIDLQNGDIKITKFSSNDGLDGKMVLLGEVNLNSKLVDLTLKLERAKIINRPDINGKASGNLTLKGDFKNLNLAGDINIRPLTLILDKFSSNQINTLDITEANHNKEQDRIDNNSLPQIGLNINLKSDKQAYLIGKGLGAELQGKIRIYGNINHPQYGGNFQTISGRYNLLGKKFVLQTGTVEFQGDYFQFIIPAVYNGKNLEITAKIYGDSKDFKLDLSSNPTMSVNDIVSNILFGKSSLSINPLQAIRLAKAMNDIANPTQSSFDPVEATKNILKVDNLTFDSKETDAGKAVNVGVGKYVTENLYIEFEKSTDPNQLLQSNIQLGITPNLSINSSGNSENMQNIGIEWRKDY